MILETLRLISPFSHYSVTFQIAENVTHPRGRRVIYNNHHVSSFNHLSLHQRVTLNLFFFFFFKVRAVLCVLFFLWGLTLFGI